MPFARRLLFLAAFVIFGVGSAADAVADQPVPWQFGFQDAGFAGDEPAKRVS